MKGTTRKALSATAIAGLFALAAPGIAGASGSDRDGHGHFGASHAVFVKTDGLAGNRIVAYDRAGDGALVRAGTYATGGNGGALNGAVVDHVASQGSLAFSSDRSLLFAVNAGSNSVSVFAVRGDHLDLRQVVESGGSFPVSIAVHGDLVYVLNAFNGASVAGYRIDGDHLRELRDSFRALGLTIPTDASQFTHTPGQVAFSPDGSQLIVTTKATTSSIDVFGVRPGGRLTGSPVINSESGTVPFAVTFDAFGHLVVANAGNNSVSTFTLNADSTLTLLSNVGTGQAATCWITQAQGVLYASNAGGPSESGIQVSPSGQLTLESTTTTDPGAVDAAATADGRFLYVQTGKLGVVDEFAVGTAGSLTEIGTVTVPGAAGGEGIVAS